MAAKVVELIVFAEDDRGSPSSLVVVKLNGYVELGGRVASKSPSSGPITRMGTVACKMADIVPKTTQSEGIYPGKSRDKALCGSKLAKRKLGEVCNL